MIAKKVHSQEHVAKMARILKVVAHPVRLQVLAALAEKDPLSVTEISDMIKLDVEQSLLSHHLIKMRENGVLTCNKQGVYVFYSIADAKLFNIIDCIESFDIL